MLSAIIALGIFFPFMNIPEHIPKVYNISYVNLCHFDTLDKFIILCYIILGECVFYHFWCVCFITLFQK